MTDFEIVSQLEGPHLELVAGLIAVATRVDGHEPIGEHKFLRIQRGDDLSAAVMAVEGERIVGYAHTLTYGEGRARRESCEAVVHPAFRRRGVGRALLAQVVTDARLRGAHRIDVWAYNNSPAGASLAASFGFKLTRRLLHMDRPLGEALEPTAPRGAVIRSFRPGRDDDAWLSLNNRVFAGHPENGTWTLDDLHARMAQPWFRADDLLMLDVNGGLAGFCWLKLEQQAGDGRVGEVYVIGAAAEYRGRGFGRYLMGRALSQLRRRGADTVAVYVDESSTSAVSLYETAGFRRHHLDVCYSREW
jgi:mycothiol synthase